MLSYSDFTRHSTDNVTYPGDNYPKYTGGENMTIAIYIVGIVIILLATLDLIGGLDTWLYVIAGILAVGIPLYVVASKKPNFGTGN